MLTELSVAMVSFCQYVPIYTETEVKNAKTSHTSTNITPLYYHMLTALWSITGDSVQTKNCIKEVVVTSGFEKPSQCGSALNLHSLLWPAGGDSTGCTKKVRLLKVYEEITLILT